MSQTEMVNPPKAAAQQKGQKSYKVIALREFQIGNVEMKDGKVISDNTRIVKPGQIVEVTKAQARDLCAKIHGAYAFSGERHIKDGDCKQHDLRRARLATEADLVSSKAITPLEDEEVLED